MGYTTVFEGTFEINRELDDETYELLKGLATTRRLKRDSTVWDMERQKASESKVNTMLNAIKRGQTKSALLSSTTGSRQKHSQV